MFDRFLNAVGKLLAWGNGAALAASMAMLLFSRGKGFVGGAGLSLAAMFLVLTICGVLLTWRTGRKIRDDAWRKLWTNAVQFIRQSRGEDISAACGQLAGRGWDPDRVEPLSGATVDKNEEGRD